MAQMKRMVGKSTPLPKRPKGVLSKGQGASNFVPGPYSKTGKDKFQDVVSAAMDTAETQKDRANIKSVIYSAGRKYKVDAAVVEKAAKAAEKMSAKPKKTTGIQATKKQVERIRTVANLVAPFAPNKKMDAAEAARKKKK